MSTAEPVLVVAAHNEAEWTKDVLKTKDMAEGDIACEVLEAEPNRLLRYRWLSEPDIGEGDLGEGDLGEGDLGEGDLGDAESRPLDTVVTFVLTRTETGGTHLRLVHSGFPAISSRAAPRCSASLSLIPLRARGRKACRRRDPRLDLFRTAPMSLRRMQWAA